MNAENSASSPDVPPVLPDPKSGCLTLLGALAAVFLLFVAVSIAVSIKVKGAQNQALVQAKQVSLALKLYAADHDGNYPSGGTLRTANDAFRVLLPNYIQSEKLFGNKLSAYQTVGPDDNFTPSENALRPGENVYSYVAGATDKMPPETPLVADGTDGTGRGVYNDNPKAPGGVWEGRKAVVIRLDNSAALEKLTGPANARYIEWAAPDGTKRNLLGPESLGPNLKLLEPAVAPRTFSAKKDAAVTIR